MWSSSLEVPSISGTAAPIVWFRQLRRFVSIPLGRGVSARPVLFVRVAVLLYPSRVRTALLAR